MLAVLAILAIFFFVRRNRKTTAAQGVTPGFPGPDQTLPPEKRMIYGDIEQPPTKPGGDIEQSFDPILAAAAAAAAQKGALITSSAGSAGSKGGDYSPASLSAAGSGSTPITRDNSSIVTASSGPSNVDPLNIMGSGAQWRLAAGTSRGSLASWELRFADIVIERSIGQGSWGHVYKGNWKSTPVAVKILLDASGGEDASGTLTQSVLIMAENSPILARLEQEASIMTQMVS